MSYSLIRHALFALEPETAHDWVLRGVDLMGAVCRAPRPAPGQGLELFGLDFPNRIGLAAGLDKDAAHIDGLAALGFGFLEVGTVTPRPQPGNPRPRVFRLPQHGALINRLGFNNGGVQALIANLARTRWQGILGINIGKNADTPLDRANDDYLAALEAVYEHASYVTVNISSPNTQGLRTLQHGDELDALLQALRHRQTDLADAHGRYVPLLIKIAPDLDDDALDGLARRLLASGVDGVIATNTTLERGAVAGHALAHEAGGLSGRPLFERSTERLAALARRLDGALPIIGVGGIFSAADAQAKIAAGASLVQVYTGLIYRGPALVSEVAAAI
jgi:dihydroorotate dehydrogenase